MSNDPRVQSSHSIGGFSSSTAANISRSQESQGQPYAPQQHSESFSLFSTASICRLGKPPFAYKRAPDWGLIRITPNPEPHTKRLESIRCIATTRFTNLLYLMPPLMVLMNWALFDERPTPLSILGMVISVVGVFLVNRR